VNNLYIYTPFQPEEPYQMH